jgi:hypothetical protein
MIYYGNLKIPFYIGVGKNGTERERHHFRAHLWQNHRSLKATYIGFALNKGDGFRFDYIKYLTRREALSIERDLISTYGRLDLGTGCLVNADAGGGGPRNPAPDLVTKARAFRHSNDAKRRIAIARTGAKPSEATRAKMRASRAKLVMPRGENHPRWISDDGELPEIVASRNKVRRWKARQRGEFVPLVDQTGFKKGPRSREAVEATASAHRGAKRSHETRARIKAARSQQVMKPRSEETKAKLRACCGSLHKNYGKTMSAETRAKMRLAQSQRREREKSGVSHP